MKLLIELRKAVSSGNYEIIVSFPDDGPSRLRTQSIFVDEDATDSVIDPHNDFLTAANLAKIAASILPKAGTKESVKVDLDPPENDDHVERN